MPVSPSKLLSVPAVAAWIALLFIPALWPYFPRLEGRLLPVATPYVVSSETVTKEGVSFYVSFEKLRQCDFIGIAWYQGHQRLTLVLEPDRELAPATRPTGGQFTGPWLLRGVDKLEGTQSVVLHRCHPFWTTITEMWPG